MRLHALFRGDANALMPCRCECKTTGISISYNKEADAPATLGLESRRNSLTTRGISQERPIAVVVNFDGGRRESHAGAGWILKGRWSQDENWAEIASESVYVGNQTSMWAELTAATKALAAVFSFVRTGRVREGW